jgi:hypothetical protein
MIRLMLPSTFKSWGPRRGLLERAYADRALSAWGVAVPRLDWRRTRQA